MPSLIDALSIATRGMQVQQTAINITGHNISNANTEGYSRQVANIETTRPFGMASMNSSAEAGQIGTGSQIASISRVRDTFLDYQIRFQSSILGTNSSRDEFLSQVENIFNEPSDTGLSSTVGKFFDSWQELAKQPQSSNARTVVAQQASTLADQLNNSYTELTNLKESAQSLIQQTVFSVNDTLNQVSDLNQQIMAVNISGNSPNDLMDKRDVLLDKLSKEFNITVDKKNFLGNDVSPVNSSPLDASVSSALVKAQNNADVKRFSSINSITLDKSDPTNKTYIVSYYKNGDATSTPATFKIQNTTSDDIKQLEESRVIWADSKGNAIDTKGNIISATTTIDYSASTSAKAAVFQPSEGELAGYKSIQGDINNYTDELNNTAKALAFSVNAIESGRLNDTTDPNDVDQVPFFVNSEAATYTNNILDKTSTGIPVTTSAEVGITAGNISINKEILNDVMKIKTRTNDNLFPTEADNTTDGETDGARALAIAQLRNTLLNIQNIDSNPAVPTDRKSFIGSFSDGNKMTATSNVNGTTVDNYFKDTVSKLGVQEQQAQRTVQNQTDMLATFQQSRDSVSGVSTDEEMANLIQYQHSYEASAKMISIIDQLLDVLINGLIK